MSQADVIKSGVRLPKGHANQDLRNPFLQIQRLERRSWGSVPHNPRLGTPTSPEKLDSMGFHLGLPRVFRPHSLHIQNYFSDPALQSSQNLVFSTQEFHPKCPDPRDIITLDFHPPFSGVIEPRSLPLTTPWLPLPNPLLQALLWCHRYVTPSLAFQGISGPQGRCRWKINLWHNKIYRR